MTLNRIIGEEGKGIVDTGELELMTGNNSVDLQKVILTVAA